MTMKHLSKEFFRFLNDLNAFESARNRKHSLQNRYKEVGGGRDGRKVDEKRKNLETTSKRGLHDRDGSEDSQSSETPV